MTTLNVSAWFPDIIVFSVDQVFIEIFLIVFPTSLDPISNVPVTVVEPEVADKFWIGSNSVDNYVSVT